MGYVVTEDVIGFDLLGEIVCIECIDGSEERLIELEDEDDVILRSHEDDNDNRYDGLMYFCDWHTSEKCLVSLGVIENIRKYRNFAKKNLKENHDRHKKD